MRLRNLLRHQPHLLGEWHRRSERWEFTVSRYKTRIDALSTGTGATRPFRTKLDTRARSISFAYLHFLGQFLLFSPLVCYIQKMKFFSSFFPLRLKDPMPTFDEGMEAYKKGNYSTALDIWGPPRSTGEQRYPFCSGSYFPYWRRPSPEWYGCIGVVQTCCGTGRSRRSVFSGYDVLQRIGLSRKLKQWCV